RNGSTHYTFAGWPGGLQESLKGEEKILVHPRTYRGGHPCLAVVEALGKTIFTCPFFSGRKFQMNPDPDTVDIPTLDIIPAISIEQTGA
ncbi:MAG: hypothetical protein KAH99_02605, partial [Verrucomicrobia bacterium]|nr:hypothetical protein [Verrucomicrobiota bacterium]